MANTKATGKLKTPDKIRATVVKMLETTPLDDITVTALCSEAHINRATFYYHFDSVQAVLAEVEDEMEREFQQFISRATVSKDGVPEKSFYVTFFDFVARNAPICRMIINSPHKSTDSFLARAMDAGRTKVISVMTKLYPDCPTSKIEYYYIFVSHGFLGLMTYWINSGMRESVSEIAEIGESVSYSGIKYLA